jgi:thioredoxin reductase
MRFNDGHAGIVTLAGIRSTGLTSSISTAQYVINCMQEQCGLALARNDRAVDSRDEKSWPGWWRHPFDSPARLEERPDYGRIVCSCENISRGEMQDAFDSCAGVATLDGLKRRTRVLTGRCQGFNCGVPTARLISQHYNIPLSSVTKRGPGTEFIASPGNERQAAMVDALGKCCGIQQHYRAVVIGAGPSGMGAAVGLARHSISPVLLIDRAAEIGGVPAKYEIKRGGVPTFVVWRRGRILFGKQFVELLARKLSRTSTQTCLECHVISVEKDTKTLTMVSPCGKSRISADAIIFACGAREKTRSERGWIFGDRPARQFFTMHLLELLDDCDVLPAMHPTIIGSDLIAYSAAAKLRAAGSDEPVMCDIVRRPVAGVLERLYFHRWTRPIWRSVAGTVFFADRRHVTSLQIGDTCHESDGIVFSGDLVPNSELVAATGLTVNQPNRYPMRLGTNALSEPGWFIAGAASGGLKGADWCYRDGLRAALSVSKYLTARI